MTKTELRQTWEMRIADLRSSGQSIPVWSGIHNLKIHQVRYWFRKFTTSSQTPVNATPQWLTVQVCNSQQTVSQSPLFLKVGAATIEVQPGFNRELLLDVVRTLSATC